ncbi:MAG: glycosyltransferase [Acidobacteriota bacterium]|nr:glycosyltransferase [Acidobacteriota bacterium]
MNVRQIARVIRGEGLSSAMLRSRERIAEAANDAILHLRGTSRAPAKAAVLNVSAGGISLRLGGVQSQLVARLELEQLQRAVVLLTPAFLQSSHPSRRNRIAQFRATHELMSSSFENAIHEALALTGARAIHLEGTAGVPLGSVLKLREAGVEVILSVHDFSLFCARPHLIEEPAGEFCFYSTDLDRCHRCLLQSWPFPRAEQGDRRSLARRLLEEARGIVFPSQFLLDRHRELFSLSLNDAEIVEPGVRPVTNERATTGRAIAFAGSMLRHKGGHLLPEVMRAFDGEIEWHIFGGGSMELLRALRHFPRTTIHGYYRAGTLPQLLAAHDIGLVILPSIWPESYLLTLSEAWLASVPVAAFDLGAVAERIRKHGGGWLTPLDSGSQGLIELVKRWKAGELQTSVPRNVATASSAADAYLELYRRWGLWRESRPSP